MVKNDISPPEFEFPKESNHSEIFSVCAFEVLYSTYLKNKQFENADH